MTFEMGEFNLQNLLDSTVKIFEQNAKAKGVEVLVKEGFTSTIYRDFGRIRQVLMNLLNNAISLLNRAIYQYLPTETEQRGLSI